MFSVEKVKIEEKSIVKSKELDKYVQLMKKHNIHSDGYELLPKNKWIEASFELHNSNSGFANAIRRTLVGELPVYTLAIDESNIKTDDEFIACSSNVLVKNLGMIPIYQDCKFINSETDSITDYEINLSVYNDSSEIININAANINIYPINKKNKKVDNLNNSNNLVDSNNNEEKVNKSSVKNITSELNSLLFPESLITLIKLRPGKFLKMKNIKLIKGVANKDAGNFSLLNNVIYKPLDIEPYDQFTEKGTRSITKNCKEFYISFITCGNISIKHLINNLVNVISENLLNINKKIEIFNSFKASTYYTGDGCEVTIDNGKYTYKFPGHYYTVVSIIASQCYSLDSNIAYCTSAVERYDTEVGILHLIHPNPNQLILKAIELSLQQLKQLQSKF
jgi:hypothetical protein